MSATLASYTVVVPARLRAAAVAEQRPATQVFVRRRLMVAMVFIAVVVALSVGAGSVLANRGVHLPPPPRFVQHPSLGRFLRGAAG